MLYDGCCHHRIFWSQIGASLLQHQHRFFLFLPTENSVWIKYLTNLNEKLPSYWCSLLTEFYPVFLLVFAIFLLVKADTSSVELMNDKNCISNLDDKNNLTIKLANRLLTIWHTSLSRPFKTIRYLVLELTDSTYM